MALECSETEDPRGKNIVDNSLEKRVPLLSVRSNFPADSLRSNLFKKSNNKWIVQRPVSSVPLTKCELKSGIRSADDSGTNNTDDSVANNDLRSFSDLPSALVSEILKCLNAKELGIISCVSTHLNTIASDHNFWKDFYLERWGLPVDLNFCAGTKPRSTNQKSWKEIFVEREVRSKSFMGSYSIDTLHGHTDAVRAVFLLKEAKLIFTGGYDSVIRMWDMEEGLSIAVSHPLGCTIRAITADSELLVAGGTNAFLQCWRAVKGNTHLFDITGSTVNQNSYFRLWGHEGPVSCLALDSAQIYSGSWDMSVRVWDRIQLKCLKTLMHGDWVWALSPRGGTVASAAGRDVYVWDRKSGDPITVIYKAHEGDTYALTRNLLGDLLFTGGEDGAIHMFEVNDKCDSEDSEPVATWIPHIGPVYSLAFEFPWLASASSDGRIALIDVRKLLKSVPRSSSRPWTKVKQSDPDAIIEPPHRMLLGFGRNLFSLDISADRIVCGGEEGVIRVWNFSQALEIEKRVQALRSARLESRMRRREAQIEMNGKNGRPDQCSVAVKRNQLNGDRSSILHSKCRLSRKLKAWVMCLMVMS